MELNKLTIEKVEFDNDNCPGYLATIYFKDGKKLEEHYSYVNSIKEAFKWAKKQMIRKKITLW